MFEYMCVKIQKNKSWDISLRHFTDNFSKHNYCVWNNYQVHLKPNLEAKSMTLRGFKTSGPLENFQNVHHRTTKMIFRENPNVFPRTFKVFFRELPKCPSENFHIHFAYFLQMISTLHGLTLTVQKQAWVIKRK